MPAGGCMPGCGLGGSMPAGGVMGGAIPMGRGAPGGGPCIPCCCCCCWRLLRRLLTRRLHHWPWRRTARPQEAASCQVVAERAYQELAVESLAAGRSAAGRHGEAACAGGCSQRRRRSAAHNNVRNTHRMRGDSDCPHASRAHTKVTHTSLKHRERGQACCGCYG